MKVRNSVLTIALHDLSRWRKMPLTAATALVPPIAIMLFLATLSLAVTQEPVALVVQGNGPASMRMAQILENDTDAYHLTLTNATNANAMLTSQQVAAVITVPSNFDAGVANRTGKVLITINNVDYDLSDDLRRSIDRSIVEFDAPSLISDDLVNTTVPNVYHVTLKEQSLRETNVDWFHYQLVPTFVLLTLNVGLVGTAILCALDEESKTARMLVLSPQRSSKLVSGRILGGMLACFAIVIPAVILSVLIGFVSIPVDQLPALFGIFLGTALCAAGIGAVIGTLVRGTRYVAFLSSVTATYLFFLGGGFTAIEFVPKWLQNLSAFVPTRYSIDALRQALFYPNPTGIPFSLLILSIYAVGCVGVGAFLMRRSWLQLRFGYSFAEKPTTPVVVQSAASPSPYQPAPVIRRSSRTPVVGAIVVLVVIVAALAGVSGYYHSEFTNEVSTANQLSSTIASDNTRIAGLSLEVSSLQTDIQVKNATIAELDAQIQTDNNNITFLQSQGSNDSSQIVSLQSQVSNDASQIVSLQSIVSSDAAQIVALQNELANITEVIWGGGPMQLLYQCSNVDYCIYLQTVPDAFAYHDNWTGSSNITVYYIEWFEFASCGAVNAANATWRSCISSNADETLTGTVGNDTFTLGEDCAGYMVIYYLTRGQTITPDISVTYDPAPWPTGACDNT